MSKPPPANWYPDPQNSALLRYWDGSQWTAHTTTNPAKQQDRPQTEQHVTPPRSEDPAESRTDEKVTFFNARSKAKELQAENARLQELLDRLHGMELADIEATITGARADLDTLEQQHRDKQTEIENTARQLTTLEAQIVDVRNTINIQEFGLYDFDHPAETSAKLANELSKVRMNIKRAIAGGHATSATANFTFNNSMAQGRKFVKDMSKTMLAAYNAEAENCIKGVKAGKLDVARKRLERIVSQIARNGQMIDLQITPYYHGLRLQELELAARHMDALRAEKEAERERRAELREQQKAEAELQRELDRLDKEKQHYLNTLQALEARGDETAAADIRRKLTDVERAIVDVDYRKANLRAGYVYVISNFGSFGERMVKIGLTRRLEPMDRVRELSDASVPFNFDVHAIFFADDAVEIEAMLHREFADKRVNRVNNRREFFYVAPEEVLEVLKQHSVAVVEFKMEPDADEFRISEKLAEQVPAS
ncbi:DUF4041 domain-containing protein [Hoyosella altamirensis]|uniref:Bacteriophage T5 Orf172 DNA-binding domain-containing protein n=1 Tax=Hoyosella altamirensis TaxID=616997 RepID=A0A839RV80_9ACTN|nr:DUF4041 domain-containing protein [Hoyosella altamirensis]MBB3040166.1 hypothetical protein [Hoyosella altamirensis]